MKRYLTLLAVLALVLSACDNQTAVGPDLEGAQDQVASKKATGAPSTTAVFVPLAQTQATIDGQIPNDGANHVGRLITITDATPMGTVHCGLFWDDYVCTVSDHDGGSPLTSTCSLFDTRVVVVGDQFVIVSQTPCNGQLDLELTPTVQGNLDDDGTDYTGRVVVITGQRPGSRSACLSVYHEYTALLINPGGPAIQKQIGLDVNVAIAPGDRFDIVSQEPCEGSLRLSLMPR